MPKAVLRDKVGGLTSLPVEAGQRLTDVMRLHGIPENAVLTRVNGRTVSEDTVLVRDDDVIEIIQVRHYDLGVTRAPARRVWAIEDAIYTKSIQFDDRGSLEIRSEQFDQKTFPAFVESVFVESVRGGDTLREAESLVLGLSGGRDSIAFLKLYEQTRERLPEVTMTAVTITGLPDWEESETFSAAIAAARKLGIDHVVATAEDVQEVFNLTVPFVDAMSKVVAGDHAASTMVIGHQVLRRMLEVSAGRLGRNTVAWGFNADDLLASMVTWWMSGMRMGSLPVRSIGDFRYTFPLYRITKKELTLYLELTAPEWNRQGAPGRFTTGPDERSMSYAIADHLLGLWPGADYYAFDAFANMQRYMTKATVRSCGNCGGDYLLQEGFDGPPGLCDVCDIFYRLELVRPNP